VGDIAGSVREDKAMLKARDIMTTDVVYTKKDAPVLEAMKLLIDHEITGVPVVDNDMNLMGILTEKDVLELFYAPEHGKGKSVEEFMTQPAVHFDEDESLEDICNLLIDVTFRRVPVTSHCKVVGIVSRPDIIRHIFEMGRKRANIAEQI